MTPSPVALELDLVSKGKREHRSGGMLITGTRLSALLFQLVARISTLQFIAACSTVPALPTPTLPPRSIPTPPPATAPPAATAQPPKTTQTSPAVAAPAAVPTTYVASGQRTDASAGSEHVVMDMAIWVLPSQEEGHCIALEPGKLDITTQLIGPPPARPTRFVFAGYSTSDITIPSPVEMTLTSATQTFTSRLGGGLYCYELANLSPVPLNADRAAITALGQYVALYVVQALP